MRSTVPWRSNERWRATTAPRFWVCCPVGRWSARGLGYGSWLRMPSGHRGRGQMTSQQPGPDGSSESREEDMGHRAAVAFRSVGELPNAVAGQFNFRDDSYEGRRLFSEVLGTFFLVLVAAGGGMVNARFGGNQIPLFVQVTAPGLMV